MFGNAFILDSLLDQTEGMKVDFQLSPDRRADQLWSSLLAAMGRTLPTPGWAYPRTDCECRGDDPLAKLVLAEAMLLFELPSFAQTLRPSLFPRPRCGRPRMIGARRAIFAKSMQAGPRGRSFR